MLRREFIAGLGSAAAWPVVARAQQAQSPVVGFLSAVSTSASSVAAFRNGLKELGYVEGQNVEIDFRLAIPRERLQSVAEDLVRHQVAVIVATGGISPPLAAKTATSTIPIVFAYSGGDPVKYGLVNSINRPGGNVTGVTV
jgi:putative ABC transport system substrate-binding protein